MNLKIEIDKHDDYSHAVIKNESLNGMISQDLKSELVFLHNDGVRNLILDLSNVTYVDSSGLSSILTGNRLFHDGNFYVVGVNHPSVKHLYKISRLELIFKTFDTAELAIQQIQMIGN